MQIKNLKFLQFLITCDALIIERLISPHRLQRAMAVETVKFPVISFSSSASTCTVLAVAVESVGFPFESSQLLQYAVRKLTLVARDC